jgi:hypothetical protein
LSAGTDDGSSDDQPKTGENMTVVPLAQARGIVADVTPLPLPAGWSDPRQFATNAATRVHHVTEPLLDALANAVRSAAAQGANDTGARTAAEALRDARIALDIAITAAGRALADREVPLRTL